MEKLWTFIRDSRIATWLISGLILVVAIASAMGLKQLQKPPATVSESTGHARVLTVSVETHSGTIIVESPGLVIPHRRVAIAAEVSGHVSKKSPECEEGLYVDAGTILIQLDDREFTIIVDQLQQEFRQAEILVAELEEERSGVHKLTGLAGQDVDLKQREADRLIAIKDVISVTDLERAQSQLLQAWQTHEQLQNQYRLLQTRWDRLKSGMALVQSKLNGAMLNLERTKIRAPHTGMIIADMCEEGSFVQKGAHLVTLEDTSLVEVKTDLEMRDLFWIWGRRVEAMAQAEAFQLPKKKDVTLSYELPGLRSRTYTWKGRLDRFDGFGLNSQSQTVPCRIIVEEPRREGQTGPPVLLPGMFVTVQIPVKPDLYLLEVPQQALRPGNIVWRVRDEKLAIIEVEFVRSERTEAGTETAVIFTDNDALQTGDTVVVTPLSFVKTGMSVESAPYRDRTEAKVIGPGS